MKYVSKVLSKVVGKEVSKYGKGRVWYRYGIYIPEGRKDTRKEGI